MTCLPGTI